MARALEIVSMIVALVLTGLILLQVKGTGMGDLLGGGGDTGGVARTRRGLEKTLFQLTIVMGVIFVAVAILSVVYTR